jgi:hypothetical protein
MPSFLRQGEQNDKRTLGVILGGGEQRLKNAVVGPIPEVMEAFACHFVQESGLAQNLAARPISIGAKGL